MKAHRLGDHGPEISDIGLGCMAFSGTYGTAEEGESIATIHEALEAGISLIDTGDFYGVGHNEMLLREALKNGRRDRVFIQVKFGAQVDPSGAFIGFDSRPNVIRTALAYTLRGDTMCVMRRESACSTGNGNQGSELSRN
jgi:aryl-alcohol dehydrogenase-like predicted oxidoreductase